ncbi:MAG: YchF/TatD family DNA exonuclease [Candidatus Omnitrophica bacterium]|nr:YchF/TatD family DNA exonuclease [Candidatus Omnitrophota bacterium]
MFVDTHCHLQFKEYDPDREVVIQRSLKESVGTLLCVGTDVAMSREANALAQTHRFIYSSVGFHPHGAKDFSESVFQELREITKSTKVVAVGEIGLDYYRNLSPVEDQKRCLRRMFDLAEEFRHPVLLHIRDAAPTPSGFGGQAYPDMIELLKEHCTLPIRGVNHCFSGSVKELQEMLDLGLYVSFAGNLTYPKSDPIREAVKACPIDRILLETDAPYLAPQSYRGKRNEPAYLRQTAVEVASLKGISLEEVERSTAENALTLFPMSHPGEEQLVYAIGDALYVNVTNACSARCTFCELSEPNSELFLKGYRLKMKRDPSVQDVLSAVGRTDPYQEVVFCGYGEPTLRIKFLVEVAQALKERGMRTRLNTNGHGNLIHRRSIVPDLIGLIDEVSVSLNAENGEKYNAIVRPHFGVGTYEKVKEFVLECKKTLPKVVVTFVEVPEIDIAACQKVADVLGVEARFRKLDVVG